MTKYGEPFKIMTKLSLTNECIENLPTLTPLIDSYEFQVKFAQDNKDYKIVIRRWKDEVKVIEVNGVKGLCFVVEETFNEFEKAKNNLQTDSIYMKTTKKHLVVSLDENCAQLTELTGGKGSSLAQLKSISETADWQVPNAVIVTSDAYQAQKDSILNFSEKIESFEKQIACKDNVERSCEEFVKWFSNTELNEMIKEALVEKMASEFGANWKEMLFAVRSSAASEDSAEMSAAGQMTTYLGVTGGLEALSGAIVRCWASQFAFVPVEYKRGYGQPIDSPMAVVVQAMVDCTAAGVIFTASPVDGDERLLTITSNFGLGESVVSASAEPDTFSLQVEIEANSYLKRRKVASIVKRVIGKKSLVTRLNPNAERENIEEGTVNSELESDAAARQSLDDESVFTLGNIALEVSGKLFQQQQKEFKLLDF